MKTLKEIKAVPEDRGYKKAVKNFTSHRLKVCPEEQDWELNEKKLNYGQVEEAPNELTLIGNMISPYLTFFPLYINLEGMDRSYCYAIIINIYVTS